MENCRAYSKKTAAFTAFNLVADCASALPENCTPVRKDEGTNIRSLITIDIINKIVK